MQASIIALLSAVVHVAAVDQLLFVQAAWRHGDRAPLETFPNDQYQENHWPQGWGELSTVGMQQQFALGARIRAMYDSSFISATYKPKEIYVRSTDVNRTLISAMSNLAGFYQTGTAGVTFPDSNSVPTWPPHWSPIPVHTVDDKTDHIGNSHPYCPRLNQLDKMMEQRDTYKTIIQQNQPLFDFLTNVTGMRVSLGDSIISLQDTLFIEQVNKLTMPSWLNDSLWNQIVNLTQISDDFAFGIYPPVVTEVIKLRGGSLLKAIINQMQVKLFCLQNPSNTSSACRAQIPRNYYVYSSLLNNRSSSKGLDYWESIILDYLKHDTTLAALLTTFRDEHQVLGMLMPKYAASIIVELWNTTSGPQVKILYHPAFNMPFQPITNLTQGCPPNSDYCPLDTFIQRSQQYMPVDINVECQAH